MARAGKIFDISLARQNKIVVTRLDNQAWGAMTDKQKSLVGTTEDDLKKIVLNKLHRLGFKWVVSIDLKHHPRRNPNWEILRWSGYPPKGFNSTMIMKHPKIAELRRKFVFKETLPM